MVKALRVHIILLSHASNARTSRPESPGSGKIGPSKLLGTSPRRRWSRARGETENVRKTDMSCSGLGPVYYMYSRARRASCIYYGEANNSSLFEKYIFLCKNIFC